MKVAEAARLLGVSKQFVRLGLQQGTLPIGSAVKMKEWAYYISEPLLEAYIGKKMPPAATGSERTGTYQ